MREPERRGRPAGSVYGGPMTLSLTHPAEIRAVLELVADVKQVPHD